MGFMDRRSEMNDLKRREEVMNRMSELKRTEGSITNERKELQGKSSSKKRTVRGKTKGKK